MDDDAVGFVRDYGFGAATNDFGAKAVAIIAFVGDERAAHGWGERQNIGRSGDIGILARGEGQPVGRTIEREDITGRGLNLVTSHSGSALQQGIINQAVRYGSKLAVTVRVITFP